MGKAYQILVICFVLVPSIFIGVGSYLAWNQAWKMKHFQPVDAVIVSTEIKKHNSGKRTTYSPEITYSYEKDGKIFTASGVYPISESRSSYSWVRKTVSMFPQGQKTTAYIHPQNPGKGFLIRQWSFFPYFFITFPLIFIGLGLCALFMSSSTKPRVPRSISGGQWFLLEPHTSVFRKTVGFLVAGGLTGGIGCLACTHYFVSVGNAYETIAIVATAGVVLLASIFVGSGVYYLLLNRTVNEAQVFIAADKVKVGSSFKATIRQKIKSMVFLEEALVGLKCVKTAKEQDQGKTRYYTETVFQELKPAVTNRQLRVGEKFEYTVDISVPANLPPSSHAGSKDYPQYCWYVSLKNRIANSPDYSNDFHLIVI